MTAGMIQVMKNQMSNKDLSVKKVSNSLPEEEQQKINKSTLGIPIVGNKALYIIMVEDPSSKPKFRAYGTAKPDKTQGYVEMTGYDITNAQIDQLRTYEDVIQLGLEAINIAFPWNRVISVRNVSFGYKIKSA